MLRNIFHERYKGRILPPAAETALQIADLKPGMRVLDAGCGKGEFLFRLTDLGLEAVGVDYSVSAVDSARETAPEASVEQANIMNIHLPPHHFDRIFFLDTMEHMHEWEYDEILKEMWRLIKPEGKLIISTCRNALDYKIWTHRFRVSAARKIRMLGFDVSLPKPPLSPEEIMSYVSQHTCFSLRTLFKRHGWSGEIYMCPDPRFQIDRIYGRALLPDDFPIKPELSWKKTLFLGLLFRWPLKPFLATHFICVLSPT